MKKYIEPKYIRAGLIGLFLAIIGHPIINSSTYIFSIKNLIALIVLLAIFNLSDKISKE